jgi:hypothetical protein
MLTERRICRLISVNILTLIAMRRAKLDVPGKDYFSHYDCQASPQADGESRAS